MRDMTPSSCMFANCRHTRADVQRLEDISICLDELEAHEDRADLGDSDSPLRAGLLNFDGSPASDAYGPIARRLGQH